MRGAAKPNPRRANGHRRNELRRRVLARDEQCWICGLDIHKGLPYGHPEAPEVDELIPVAHNGSPYDPNNCAATHSCCNRWRKTKSVALINKIRAIVYATYGKPRSPMKFVELAKATQASMKHESVKSDIKITTKWF